MTKEEELLDNSMNDLIKSQNVLRLGSTAPK